jgi:lipid II:glycine glycyltransferase (peptidoglycan interpeptide bridge formation enzyme)
MDIKVVETYDTRAWNNVAPHPLASWEWGEARKKMGIDVLRIAEEQGGNLRNVFQITYHPIPHTGMTVGYMPRTTLPNSAVLDEIRDQSQKRKAVFVKMEPYVFKSTLEDGNMSEEYEKFRSATTHSVHPLFPQWTQILDLEQSEEDLYEGLKPKWRYNIGLAQRKGVIVKEMTSAEGFDVFAKLYFETTRRQDYAGHGREYHRVIFDTLKDSISHILVAYYNNTPLSAYHLFLFNNVLYYPYGGSAIVHREVMASNLLMWEAIRFGQRHGARVFDMWGSLPPGYNPSAGGWAGFTRFKEGYGTEFVELIGSYDLVLNQILYRVYNVADVLRKKFIL